MKRADPAGPKHLRIYRYLHGRITEGKYREGDRLPSENELARQFETSRPTAARALRDLQSAGLVDRRVGSGTYVRRVVSAEGRLFGLLVPGLGETEIFDPICGQIAREAQLNQHVLLWGDTETRGAGPPAEWVEQICRDYISRHVAGVFFAPLELVEDFDEINRRVVGDLGAAGIPVVLLDRDVVRYPKRSRYDLVGIDNRRAGDALAGHLLELGARRIDFVAHPGSAPTVAQRVEGCRDALRRAGIESDPSWLHEGDAEDLDFVRGVVGRRKGATVICANDLTAARMMQSLGGLGMRVPKDVRIAAFDDVHYARLLRPPLTTVRQPCRDIGAAAMTTMHERIARPGLPARDVLLDAKLVVRESCGAK
ncbi:MAG: GntR family transcriptional regulator [Planctomycetota bacterium]|jgi:DNA-binding LacI/PurR family transcriptional regulator